MREGEILYIVAALIYFAETLLNVPVNVQALVRPLRRWRLTSPLVLRSGAGPAFLILNPLWPGSLVVVPGGGTSLGIEAVRTRVTTFVRATRWLRAAEVLLFVSVFVGGALLVWWERVPPWIAFGLMGVAWLVVVLLTIWLVRRRSLPRPPLRELVFALLSPLSSVRIHDRFGRLIVTDAGQDTVAAALLEGEARVGTLRRSLMRARVLGVGDALVIERLIRSVGLDPEALTQPPAREATAVAYCPVCREQFAVADVGCDNCGVSCVSPYEIRT